MKKSVMLKWVKALRSGKYKQTRNKLKGPKGFCCLGVLCDISNKGEWSNLMYEYPSYDSFSLSLPDSVRVWAGIQTTFVEVENMTRSVSNGENLNLSHLNDSRKWNFKKIANFIEKNYKKL